MPQYGKMNELEQYGIHEYDKKDRVFSYILNLKFEHEDFDIVLMD